MKRHLITILVGTALHIGSVLAQGSPESAGSITKALVSPRYRIVRASLALQQQLPRDGIMEQLAFIRFS